MGSKNSISAACYLGAKAAVPCLAGPGGPGGPGVLGVLEVLRVGGFCKTYCLIASVMRRRCSVFVLNQELGHRLEKIPPDVSISSICVIKSCKSTIQIACQKREIHILFGDSTGMKRRTSQVGSLIFFHGFGPYYYR